MGPRGVLEAGGPTEPGGTLRPSAHQQVAALKTTFPRGPGWTVAVNWPPLGLPSNFVGAVATHLPLTPQTRHLLKAETSRA